MNLELTPGETVKIMGVEYTLIERIFTAENQKPMWFVVESHNPAAQPVLKVESDLLKLLSND